MSDPFDDLKSAMDQATPAPDPARRAETLRLSAESFDATQGSADHARPNADRPKGLAAIGTGVRHMISALATRGGLTATTAIVAVGVFVSVPQLRDGVLPGGPEILVKEVPSTSTPATVTDLRREPTAIIEEYATESLPLADLGGSADTGYVADAEPMILASPVESAPAPEQRLRLMSEAETVVGGLVIDDLDGTVIVQEDDTEAFANAENSPVKIVAETPVSTFSVDVDTASYAVLRSSLMNGVLPPSDAVRIEEMVNYFSYAYAPPEAGDVPFQSTVSVIETPWNPDTRLMRIGIQGEVPVIEDRPPLNLVFLIDTSGSMHDPNKLPLLKQSFRLMLSELRPEDQVAIITYAGSAGQVLPPTSASDRTAILAALGRLEAGGSTAGQAGLQRAYATAEAMAAEGEVTRVILATDGDFNVGLSNPADLENFIATKRESGTYLSVLGFGRGNLDDATMQALAQNGNGQAAYIDTLSEARKVLVDQLTGALFPIANDVKIQVEFNPAVVAEYRLIGYETRALRREDFNNDAVDAGEIGAGHRVTALYEVTPVGSPAVLNDPLRFAPEAEVPAEGSADLAFLRLRYKEPGADESKLIEQMIPNAVNPADQETQFAAAIAGFGQLLRQSVYLGEWDYDEAITLAESALGEDRFGYRREAVTLMQLAASLSEAE